MLVSRADQLEPEYQELAKTLALSEIQADDPALNALSDHSRGQVLELASEYIAYLNAVFQKDKRTPGILVV